MKEPIKVLYWGMTDNIGGIESFIINVFRNIDKEKVQIDFLLGQNATPIAFEDELKKAGSNIYRVMVRERDSIIKARKSLDNFFIEHNDYKAVHIHANIPYAFPLKYAKKHNVPLRIIHSHNSNEDKQKQNIFKELINKCRSNQIKRQIKKYPNCYIACSDLAAEYMFPNKKYIWIKNGIDLKEYQFDINTREEVRSEWGADDDCHILGFIGRLRPQKNVFFMVNIFREYLKYKDNSKLVIAGIGEQEEELKQYATDLLNDGKIILLGKREDSNRLYQGFDAFLLPSLYEGFPVVLVESQTAGLPSFVSDLVTKQVALTDTVNYLSLNQNADEWAKIINKTIASYHRKDGYDEMFKAGFDIESIAKELEDIYLK